MMPTDNWIVTASLVAAWLLYFVAHSLLASLWLKQKVAAHYPNFMPAYRLAFNVIAVVLLLPIAWITMAHSWPQIWQWQGGAKSIANGLGAFAVVGFVWSLKYYDMQEFIGLSQLRGHVTAVEEQEHLKISPLHRFVRHPWYFFALVMVWSRDMDVAQFISSVMVSIYFFVGSRFEERKLLTYYGERYRQYMRRVPGLFPWPGRVLSATEARELEK